MKIRRISLSLALSITLSMCLWSTPTWADDYENALMAKGQGAYEEAHIHIRNLLKRDPDNLAGNVLYGQILAEMGQAREAEDVFAGVYARGADKNLFLVEYANALMLQNKYEDALTITDPVGLPDTFSQHSRLTIVRANAFQALGQAQQAIALLKQQLQQQNQSHPNNVDLQLALASTLINDNQSAAATTLLNNINDRAKRTSQYWFLLGRIDEANIDLENALAHYQRALGIDQQDLAARKALAGTQLRLGNISQAETTINKALEQSPNDPGSVYVKSKILAAQGDDQAAEQGFDYISNLISLVDDHTKQTHPELMLIDAMASYNANSYELAAAKFNAYLQREPDDLNALVLLSRVFSEQGKSAQSLQVLQAKEMQLARHDSYAIVLAKAYVDNGDTTRATRILRGHQLRFPDDPNATLLLAKLNFDSGNFAGGMQHINALREQSPALARGFAQALVNQGKQSFRAGDLPTAYLYLKAAANVEITDIEAMYQLANLGRQLDVADDVSALFKTLVTQYPQNGFLLEILAEHLMIQSDYEQSILYYSKLLTRTLPVIKQSIALNNLAHMYTEKGHYQLAISHAEQAVALRPDIPAFFDTLGWALTQSGKPGQGKRYLEKALAMAGNAPDIQSRLDYTNTQLRGY